MRGEQAALISASAPLCWHARMIGEMSDLARGSMHCILDTSVHIALYGPMARPKEFDRGAAVAQAISVFWLKGYAATSTDDLLRAMKIGRQSMYDTFGDKRRLYVEALERYQLESVAGHINRLRSVPSPLAGIETLLVGLISLDRATRERGCMGVGAICEFGNADTELGKLRVKSGSMLHKALVERLQDAQAAGEIRKTVSIERAARFVETTMLGLQVAARAGESVRTLRDMAAFAIAGLRNR
jgi:TetR/AcrR family transcriptional regulator, transcriptional repressor for nem operon